jgi:hypothetical protein
VESLQKRRRVKHKYVFYLGGIAEGQRRSREDTLEIFDERQGRSRQLRLFASECSMDEEEVYRLPVRLSGLSVRRPRQWGGCWLDDNLWKPLALDSFSRARMVPAPERLRLEKSCEG